MFMVVIKLFDDYSSEIPFQFRIILNRITNDSTQNIKLYNIISSKLSFNHVYSGQFILEVSKSQIFL